MTDLSEVAKKLQSMGYPYLSEGAPQYSLLEPVDLFAQPDLPSPGSLPPLRGIALSTSGGEWHVRFQDSRVSVEWIRQSEPYPRFSQVKNKFLQAVNVYETALGERGFSKQTPLQVEITYLNQLEAARLQDFLRIVGSGPEPFTSGVEYNCLSESLRYVFEISQTVTSTARLYIDCYPTNNGNMFLRLAYFARLANNETSHVDNVLEIGHLAINELFNSVTREDLQISKWGRSPS